MESHGFDPGLSCKETGLPSGTLCVENLGFVSGLLAISGVLPGTLGVKNLRSCKNQVCGPRRAIVDSIVC